MVVAGLGVSSFGSEVVAGGAVLDPVGGRTGISGAVGVAEVPAGVPGVGGNAGALGTDNMSDEPPSDEVIGCPSEEEAGGIFESRFNLFNRSVGVSRSLALGFWAANQA